VRSSIGKLSDTVKECKSFTARKILEAIEDEPESRREWMLNLFEFSAKQNKRNEHHQFWTHENHAEIICCRDGARPVFTRPEAKRYSRKSRACWNC
jgi:hypothetical protein